MFDRAEKLFEEDRFEEALALYYELEKDDHAEAIYSIGWCFEYGLGVEQNYEVAIQKYKKAYELSFVKAAKRLGYCYYEGGHGIDADDKEALTWFLIAAEADLDDVYEKVGELYSKLGENDKAKEAYEKGVEKGEADCYAGLCDYYLSVGTSPSAAWKYAKKGHEAGSWKGSLALYSILTALNYYNDAFEPATVVLKNVGESFEENFEKIGYAACANECSAEDALELSIKYYEGVNGKKYYDPAAVCIQYAMKSLDGKPFTPLMCDVYIQAARLFLDNGFKNYNFEVALNILEALKEETGVKPEALYMLAECYDNETKSVYLPIKAENIMKRLAQKGYKPAQNYCKKYAQKDKYIANGVCSYCGGAFKGLFSKTCKKCGKKKNY